ncbi:MAG TPA: trypsin-like peptidase domain-containing protein [Candidatus Limnocylindrales bacterium]|nr:trypsin-like peptidase domain-containing protein [Candidatus Limnocylindrales bacterium]
MASSGLTKALVVLLMVIFVVGLFIGGLTVFYFANTRINNLSGEISNLESQVSDLKGFQNATYQDITILQNGTSLTGLYDSVRDSIVLIVGNIPGGTQQGSGFVYNSNGTVVVLTNYHVVHGTSDLSVTFADGHGYSAKVLGTDPYSDLAVVSVNASASEFKPLSIVSSSTLAVGDSVIAIGNPYGLVGSMTTGVVSALGRTITENTTGGFSIANIIQTSTPINPGNSGGPLLNAAGNVVGITTAIVSNSQGLGFAVPSDTILKELYALITTGSYSGHSYLGLTGEDMTYDLAQQTGSSVTYGWKIDSVVSGGPSDGKLKVGDIIIALNGQTITNGDELASYLEEHTLPGDTIAVTAVRGTTQINVSVVLGQRPPPSS